MEAVNLKRYKHLKNKADILEVEEFVNNIDDPQTQDMFRYRFFYECSWKSIASNMGGGMTEDCARKRVKRYINDHIK